MLQKHTQVRNLTFMWNAVMMIASCTIKFYWKKQPYLVDVILLNLWNRYVNDLMLPVPFYALLFWMSRMQHPFVHKMTTHLADSIFLCETLYWDIFSLQFVAKGPEPVSLKNNIGAAPGLDGFGPKSNRFVLVIPFWKECKHFGMTC